MSSKEHPVSIIVAALLCEIQGKKYKRYDWGKDHYIFAYKYYDGEVEKVGIRESVNGIVVPFIPPPEEEKLRLWEEYIE